MKTKKDYNREYYHKNKERILQKEYVNKLRRRYGLTPSDIEALIVKQGGCCACCNTPLDLITPKNKHIDHCHKTNKVRGVLCVCCNSGLGIFKDDPKALRRAADYLEKSI